MAGDKTPPFEVAMAVVEGLLAATVASRLEWTEKRSRYSIEYETDAKTLRYRLYDQRNGKKRCYSLQVTDMVDSYVDRNSYGREDSRRLQGVLAKLCEAVQAQIGARSRETSRQIWERAGQALAE